ncbi:MAG: ABC transporter ATP-binding protein [Syntrophobacteraceae bacterium]
MQDVSFEIQKGESFGIIGHNGAGKSTILKHLCGIMKPTRGTIEVHGRLSALIEVGAGFHPDLTGRENIFLNGIILGMKKEEIKAKFDEIVEFSGLQEFIDTPVKRYSSGMYARLGFSVAAHLEPDILVIDEVLSVGDFVFQAKCVEKMDAILQTGVTIIFVSHNLKAVADLCQRTLLLGHGKAIETGPTKEVIKTYMTQGSVGRTELIDREVSITRVSVHSEQGEDSQFETGQKVYCEIEIAALVLCDRLSISIYIRDDNVQFQSIFNTSTERLKHPTFSLDAGDKLKIIFELHLHLAPARYHFGAAIYRYDIQKKYHELFPAATIYIHSEKDVRGIANLYPNIVSASINWQDSARMGEKTEKSVF